MTILSIEGGQGSPAWLARRAERLADGSPARWHASDAPAMMGCPDAHETRNQLLARLHSGIDKEFSDFVQERVIDPGHDFERRGRVLADALIDDSFAPVLVEHGRISASLDGRTLDGVQFEHKRMRAELRALLPDIGAAISGPEFGRRLPMAHRVQIAHQHLADPDCERTLFGATEWDGDRLVAQRWCWVGRDRDLCAKVAAGWVQLEKDLQAYVPPEAVPIAVAAPLEHLPAVSVQVSGALAVVSNLAVMAPRLHAFIERMPKAPSTDQEFADCEAACKRLREAQVAIEGAVNGALASISDVNELRRVGGELAEIARAAALAGEKVVKQRKDELRLAEVERGRRALAAHIVDIDAHLGGRYMPAPLADFGVAIKGLKTLDSIRNAIDTALATAKIAADALGQRITDNLHALRDAGPDAQALFADKAALVLKDPEAVVAIVAQRLAERKAAEEKRLEAERERIRAEEAARLQREAAARVQEVAAPPPATSSAAAAPVCPMTREPCDRTAEDGGTCEPGKCGLNKLCYPPAPPPLPRGGPIVTIGALCEIVAPAGGFTITQKFVESLGVPVRVEKASKLVDQAALKAALLRRIGDAL